MFRVTSATYRCLRVLAHRAAAGVILAVLPDRESEASWTELLTELVARGLSGVQMIIRDEHGGLIAAARKVLPEARQQRCTVHLIRNVFTQLPKQHQKCLARELVAVLHADSLTAANAKLRTFSKQFGKQFPEAVACLERGFADATSYFAFPNAHWIRLRSTNGLERLHGEIKRRTRAIGAFPDRASALRLITAVALQVTTSWSASTSTCLFSPTITPLRHDHRTRNLSSRIHTKTDLTREYVRSARRCEPRMRVSRDVVRRRGTLHPSPLIGDREIEPDAEGGENSELGIEAAQPSDARIDRWAKPEMVSADIEPDARHEHDTRTSRASTGAAITRIESARKTECRTRAGSPFESNQRLDVRVLRIVKRRALIDRAPADARRFGKTSAQP